MLSLTFRKSEHSKLRGIQGGKSDIRKILGKKCPKIWVNLARLFSFPNILKNVLFFTGNFWKFNRKGPSIVSCYSSNQLHPGKRSTVKEKCLVKLRGFFYFFFLLNQTSANLIETIFSCLSPLVSKRVINQTNGEFRGTERIRSLSAHKKPCKSSAC